VLVAVEAIFFLLADVGKAKAIAPTLLDDLERIVFLIIGRFHVSYGF